jgi:hypothetical protein
MEEDLVGARDRDCDTGWLAADAIEFNERSQLTKRRCAALTQCRRLLPKMREPQCGQKKHFKTTAAICAAGP